MENAPKLEKQLEEQNENDLEDLPELEDLPSANSVVNQQTQTSTRIENQISAPVSKSSETKIEKKVEQKQSQDVYEKMGQMFSSNSKKPAEKSQEKPSEKLQDKNAIESVSAKNPTEKSAIVSEVQKAFESKNLSGDPNFVQSLLQNETLRKGFSNPRLMQLVGQAAKDPSVFQKHQNDAEFVAFFKEYMKILAGNFESLAQNQKEQQKNKEKEEEMMKEIKRESFSHDVKNNKEQNEIEILMRDSELKNLVGRIQTEGRIDFHELARKNPQLAQKVKVLMDKGFFKVDSK